MPTHADIASANGVVTGYGRKFVSVEWCERGKQFIGAALLLYTNAGSSYVVAHLVAQGIELLGKSYLLWTGSATPQTLKQIGHDLVKLREVVAPHLDSRILGTREVQQSLADLNALFRRHALRYPDFLEHIFAPPEIPDCAPLLQQIRLWLRLAKKHRVWQLHQ